jgi:dCMP deaminase
MQSSRQGKFSKGFTMHERPDWDQYFMEIAQTISKRSTCLRRQMGALLVRDRRILSTGYNGAPSGLPHCDETGCLRQQLGIPSGERQELCRALHAEQNAFLMAAMHGVSVAGATLYVTHQPCITCAKMLINAGVKRVVIMDDYPDTLSREFLAQAEVELVRLENPAAKQESEVGFPVGS